MNEESILPYSVGFEVRVERAERLVAVTLTGIPSPEDVGWIAEEVRAAILLLGPDAGQHNTLYDVRGVPVLPKETADFVLHSFSGHTPQALWARRLAFVTSTALTRRQVRRVADVRPGAAVFDDIDAARAWLAEPPAVQGVNP